jgi:hypothetical protein
MVSGTDARLRSRWGTRLASGAAALLALLVTTAAFASEADIKVPDLKTGNFLGMTGHQLLLYGLGVCVFGLIFGMVIFSAIKKLPLAFACIDSYFFIGYLISIAVFGLYQAIFMADAGGAWDNAKKIVETELKEKGSPLHAAVVVGDTVGDPFKDTSSVAMNPVIKFTTLFGVLAVELAIELQQSTRLTLAGIFFVIALVFVYRSFYNMRIKSEGGETPHAEPKPAEKHS